MLCGSCNQNEATIHLTEIVNNQVMEVHLCESCAEEKGTDFKTHFNFSELMAGLSDIGPLFKETKPVIECKTCGLSYEEFAKKGRLGCCDCYKHLQKLLLPLIKRVQRATAHLGKRPSQLSGDARKTMDMRDLRERLKKAVQNEEFEEAARLRDEIKQFEEKSAKGKKSNG